jgi:dTDP-4-amino-4,6-dideoxygalactose transaminase
VHCPERRLDLEAAEMMAQTQIADVAPFSPWPAFDEEQRAAAAAVLQSGRVNYWTGEEGVAFEQEYARACGVPHAVAVANGTVGLELALHALRLEPGDEVIVTPRSFIASVSCAVTRGLVPVFADVDRDSQNLDPAAVARAITPRTRAIIAVHLAGWPCDMLALTALARDNGLKVIEDCAQANGAAYLGRPVGSWGDVAVFSFCQDKIITTGGEGGMLVTADADLWERAWAFKDHGKSRALTRDPRGPSTGFRWVHNDFGTNWRLTEIQSALGRIQLRRLSDWVGTRQRLAALLTDGLGRISGLRVTVPPAEVSHAYYKYYVFLRPEMLNRAWNRDRILERINSRGIPCFTGSCSEIYLEKAFDGTPWRPEQRLPVARELGETSLQFLVHPTLTSRNMLDTCAVVREVMAEATR